MANPQPENGFVKLANEIWNELIRRNFSKRQKDILLFIWRLSYGCNLKDAYISKSKDFEICGVPATQIKKELLLLESARVIKWDRENKVFSINKDYEFWQISPVMGWDSGRFNELIHENIKRKTSQNMNFSTPENFTKHEDFEEENFMKREDEGASNHCGSKAEDVSKDSSFKDIKDIKDSSSGVADPFILFENHKFGVLDATTKEMIQEVIDDSAESWVVEAMKEAIKLNKISWRYVETILKRWSGIPHTEPWTVEREPPSRNGSPSQQYTWRNKVELRNEEDKRKIKEAEERERARSQEITLGYPQLL